MLRDIEYCKFNKWCKFSHRNLQLNGDGDLNKQMKDLIEKIERIEVKVSALEIQEIDTVLS